MYTYINTFFQKGKKTRFRTFACVRVREPYVETLGRNSKTFIPERKLTKPRRSEFVLVLDSLIHETKF